MLVLSGMSTLKQVEDNVSFMEDFEAFSQEEHDIVRKAADIINRSVPIPCTGCAYCINDCPQNIAILRYFALYNEDMRELDTKPWTTQKLLYSRYAQEFGKASACIGCGKCEHMCPQHLPIRSLLEKVAEHFEPAA